MATAAAEQEKVETQPRGPVQPVAPTQPVAPVQPAYYPPQNIDSRYAAAPVMPEGQQYQPVEGQHYQPAPQQMHPEGVSPQYTPQQQHVPMQYQQELPE